MALAGLVAALAIPVLIIDSPAPAGGVETGDQVAAGLEGLADATTTTTTTTEQTDLAVAVSIAEDTGEFDIEVVMTEMAPDITRLANQAATWNVARSQAVADGMVQRSTLRPPSDTNLALLPKVDRTPAEPEPEPDPAPLDPEPVDPEPAPDPVDPDPTEPEPPVEEPVDPVESEKDPAEPADPAPVDAVPEPDPVEPEPDPAPVDPDPEPPVIDEPFEDEGPRAPKTPAQVDGRVPPPSGGPTAAQWNAVRKCESTHNYRAISPSGLYRGAYQFSQQTWDWVAGIHQPHLVGIDPIDAEPAWQDVMAYTLYAMRGWDQWPICGKHLL